MPSVVFLRAVNVGGTNRCQPALIAKGLAKFGVVNIGAVGTFVVREAVSESALRAAIAKKLPCETCLAEHDRKSRENFETGCTGLIGIPGFRDQNTADKCEQDDAIM